MQNVLVMLTKTDLKNIKEIIDSSIEEKVPAIVDKRIEEKVPDIVEKKIKETVPVIVKKIVDSEIQTLTHEILLVIAEDLHKAIKKNRSKIRDCTHRINIVSSKLDKLIWDVGIIDNQVWQNDGRIEKLEAICERKESISA